MPITLKGEIEMSAYIKLIIAMLSLLTAAAFAQCPSPTLGIAQVKAPMQTSQSYSIMTANNLSMGTYLTDSRGMTLYHLTTDEGKNMSTCTSATCEGNWPLFYNATLKVPSNLNSKDFGSITANGNNQTTYKGWPLYYFIADKKQGDINGQGKGGVWSVVDPTSSNTFPKSFPYKG